MAIVQNTAGQGLYVYAYDNTTDLAKTGDSANITATISKDGGGLLAGEGWPAACRRVGHNGCYYGMAGESESRIRRITLITRIGRMASVWTRDVSRRNLKRWL